MDIQGKVKSVYNSTLIITGVFDKHTCRCTCEEVVLYL